MSNIDKLSIAAIRCTAIDMINKAKSGHPGMALGSAPIMYALFKNFLNSDPYDPKWINRDRFVLSAGHASSLLYVMLHVCNYNLSMDDLKQFRQLNSKTPGHPEFGHTDGVDSTSGPLGQGIAQAVGMALAEANLNARYPKYIDHYTYCLCGDGCLEEGISQEAISFAGKNKLNKLILLYDKNDVTLDGPLSISDQSNTELRFKAENWNVLNVEDGNDVDEISSAIKKAQKSDYPTVIIIKTVIGYGSKNAGTHKVHGSPLASDDIKQLKESFEYNYPEFTIPQEVYENFKDTFVKRGFGDHSNWLTKIEKLKSSNIMDYKTLFSNDVSYMMSEDFNDFKVGSIEATRKSSNKALNYYSKTITKLIGGSADVEGSVLTKIDGSEEFSSENYAGTNIRFGIREFLMASIANGILLHSGLRPFVGCFLVFSDYMKSAIRMSALSNLPVIYIFSHDSIGVGQDGPTHQPIEQLAMLRSIPNLNVIRPCDARETYAAYKHALLSLKTPTAIITARNESPALETSSYDGVSKGGYIISKEKERVDFTIISTGSEVSLCLKAQELLLKDNIDTRIVSMPSFFNFDMQSDEYKKEVFGVKYCKRIFVEMLSSYGLNKYAKHTMAIDHFGNSAPYEDLVKYYNYTPEGLAEKIKNIIGKEKIDD